MPVLRTGIGRSQSGATTRTINLTGASASPVLRLTASRQIYSWPEASPTTDIEGVSAVAFTGSGAVLGLGQVSGASSPAFTGSGALMGRGAVSGTISTVFATSGGVEGRGLLNGASAMAFSASGAVVGTGAISGATSLSFAPGGSIDGLGSLTGASGLTFAVSGALDGLGELGGGSELGFATDGTLHGAGELVGVVSISVELSGTLEQGPSQVEDIDPAIIKPRKDHSRQRRRDIEEVFSPTILAKPEPTPEPNVVPVEAMPPVSQRDDVAERRLRFEASEAAQRIRDAALRQQGAIIEQALNDQHEEEAIMLLLAA